MVHYRLLFPGDGYASVPEGDRYGCRVRAETYACFSYEPGMHFDISHGRVPFNRSCG